MRFWEKVALGEGCWAWQGDKCDGYGRVRVQGRHRKAHRIAYEMLNGPIPVGLYICHHCDNPSCVRPSHLYAGTQRDNMRDRGARGRGANLKGESHGRAKLNEDAVRAIRSRKAAGARTTELAREYGVSPSAIVFVVNGSHWRHVA